jgi:hypothetical protein
MAGIQTKKRSLLAPERVRQIALIREDLVRQFSSERPKTNKRKYGAMMDEEESKLEKLLRSLDPPVATALVEDDDSNANIETLVDALTETAARDDDADDDNTSDVGLPSPEGKPRLYFGTKELIHIPDLWDFNRSRKMESWTGLWKEGEHGLDIEEVWLSNQTKDPLLDDDADEVDSLAITGAIVE